MKYIYFLVITLVFLVGCNSVKNNATDLSNGIEFERMEKINLWVHKDLTEANDMLGNKIKCFQVQYNSTLDLNKPWEPLCDSIESFKFKKGKQYHLSVHKKWIKDHELLADHTPYILELDKIIEEK